MSDQTKQHQCPHCGATLCPHCGKPIQLPAQPYGWQPYPWWVPQQPVQPQPLPWQHITWTYDTTAGKP